MSDVITLGRYAAENSRRMRRNEKPTRALWLDLDGTVRHGKDELGHFVNSAEDVVIFDGVTDILHTYKRNGWRIIGVSNQGGIATGFVRIDDVVAAMARTQSLTNEAFDKIAWCSHFPGVPDLEMSECWCRKPRIGLLIDAGNALNEQYKEFYPPSMGLLVGDRQEDEDCAHNAGLPFMQATLWRNGGWQREIAQ